MNLAQIAGPVVATVNPTTPVKIQLSNGYTTAADGVRSPAYCDPVFAQGQVQPLSFRDIQQIDGLNIQGVRWKIYLYGEIDGLVRPENKGGDLVTILAGPHAGIWLVALVLEQYKDWVSAAITLQNQRIERGNQ